MKKPIISIDWDHTFRNMQGVDLNILSLVCYAKAKNILVGLTTHRDIENTALYTLYYWQFKKPEHNETALGAAIHYWQENFLDPFNIKLDFINARYQPNYGHQNYYEKILLPHEIALAINIKQKNILDDPKMVKKIIDQYQQLKEEIIDNNEFKGAQLNWLAKHYENKFNGTIYHIDDSHEVCKSLLDEFKKINNDGNVKINTLWYNQSPLFFNDSCTYFLRDIELLSDWENFLQNNCAPFCDNDPLYLSLCLLATQISHSETNILDSVESNLNKLRLCSNEKTTNLCTFIKNLINQIKKYKQPIYFFLNEWV